MIVLEPIKATISFALENFAYSDAIFLSERLHAEVATDESLFLLANAYYRSGKPNVAYVLLTEKHTKICRSPQCLFLQAKCCFDLKKFGEALSTLTGPFAHSGLTLDNDTPKLVSRDELLTFYGELSSFVAQLLGSVYVKLDCNKQASHYYKISLKINPFLWSSYEKLVQLDPKAVEVSKLLSPDNLNLDLNGSLELNGNSQSAATPLRRSSRLNSNWVKENTTATTKASKIPRTPTKRSRRTINFDKNSDPKLVNENLKVVTSIDVTKNLSAKVQRSSAFGLLELMSKLGSAFKLLSEFKCKEAIEEFQRLPTNHVNTGFVLSSIGRAYFEMSKYDEAINYFKKCRQLEPYRLQGLEVYSTALWHQQKEVELSCLAKTLIDFDKHAPETWCVAGNCFSLQKEHEISIKFLKRAIQVDPDFCYAYTLLGHELVSADELDNAMACFRNATRIDNRHYNAWYGIGMIFYKQEKYMNAFQMYKRALDISPYNPILMCHLAIVCHHMKKSPHEKHEKRALELLNKASQLDPSNALVKFHRASINFATENYDVAMEELEQLKQIVPKESMVYFLIGKIHKIKGETHLALMNFSWAMDLDPKGASNQIKELIDRHYGNDDEIMIHSNSNGANSNGYNIQEGSGSSNSTPNTTPFQQRSTLTPTGGVAGPSGAGPSTASSAGASTSSINNGSNNSNNISNNSGNANASRSRVVNSVRRYIIHEYEGDVIPEDDDEDDDDEPAEDDEDDEAFEANELADSTNLLDNDSVTNGAGNTSDNVDATFQDDDSLML